MSESYCMKPCSECGGCSGCRAGAYSARCDIAKCCKEKGHLSCESCTRSGGCPTRLSRDRIPELLQEKERKAAQVLQEQKQRICVMKAWLPLIFGALVTNNVVSLVLGLFDYLDTLPTVATLEELLSVGLTLVAGFGFWKLQEADEGFHFVAVFFGISSVFRFAYLFLPGEGVLNTVLTLLFAAVGVISMRSEYLSFQSALSGSHQELSEKWEKQWTQTVCSLAAFGVSLLISLLIPLLGVVVLLCSLAFIIFLSIRHLVYLYQTMDFCREYDRA